MGHESLEGKESCPEFLMNKKRLHKMEPFFVIFGMSP